MQKVKRPRLVGVLHLPALPGAPLAAPLDKTVKQAVREARILEDAGFDALIIENFGDVPFYKSSVPAVTIATMSVIASHVRESVRVSLGINVLRNDAHAALAIALATNCQFIRVNVLSGVSATDQGIIEADAANLMRARASFGARGTAIQVWGDALVKHAEPLSGSDVELALEEVALRSLADAVILTGSTTGRAVDLVRLQTAAKMKLPVPIYLGSGVTLHNMDRYAPLTHGIIVGSALRVGGQAGAPLDVKAAQKFSKAWMK
jgi:membrane complex biogenesis BtpA family protein